MQRELVCIRKLAEKLPRGDGQRVLERGMQALGDRLGEPLIARTFGGGVKREAWTWKPIVGKLHHPIPVL